ncbi:hypothetical protein [Duganella sp. BJB475]|uniref:hypothetical protein n=1 Tax=Duganella sp. BJB475 TaxID=2233914 RepID=UPI000E344474|nr:hypothetical protein [Duganella sp. BJB475]RFP19204.1 hypothetical protein D0T23_05345 [Duganella sp. BJB475]
MMDAKPPRDGDIVRQRGCPTGRKMLVEASELGDQHDWEGVRNGVYCTWKEDGEERFEVYRAGDLVVVERAAD